MKLNGEGSAILLQQKKNPRASFFQIDRKWKLTGGLLDFQLEN